MKIVQSLMFEGRHNWIYTKVKEVFGFVWLVFHIKSIGF